MAEHEVEIPNVKELHEKRENDFSKLVAMITACFAVILAITSLGGNEAMKETILAQQQASDNWAYYQAKNIRENIYKVGAMVLEAEKINNSNSATRYSGLLAKMQNDTARYSSEKKEIEKEAKKLEAERDKSREKNVNFEYGAVLIQIAIVMSSVAILAKSRLSFYFAVAIAAIGVLFAINGFFLIIPLAF